MRATGRCVAVMQGNEMAAVLIAVVVALLLGHFVPVLAGWRHFGVFSAWLRALEAPKWLSALQSSRFGLLLAVGLPVALVVLIQLALRGHGYGLPSFVFAALVLFYCWGPRDLDRDVSAVLDASDHATQREAARRLAPESRPVRLSGAGLVEAAFRGALSRWFAVLLWFLLLGPAGAVLYRLAALIDDHETGVPLSPMHAAAAGRLRAVLEWPVAQLMVLSLGLVANMDAVFHAWRDWFRQDGRGFWSLDSGFLGPVARAGVDRELADDEYYDPEDGSEPPPLLELQDAMSLIWRMLLLWLTVLALFVLAGVVN